MNKINYIIGDATHPIGEGEKIICHVCNDIGKWGQGFVLAISKRWKTPEQFYRDIQKYILGDVRLVHVEKDIWVANMIGQHLIGVDENGNPPIRYDAVREALSKVNEIAVKKNATLHCPKFGAGLSGGDWNIIEKIIKETITVPITIYSLK
jgi:O-acetyl-ADP-ribose deacetylase (regulator of RNase III)